MNQTNPVARGWQWLRQAAVDTLHMPPDLALANLYTAALLAAGIAAIVWLFRERH